MTKQIFLNDVINDDYLVAWNDWQIVLQIPLDSDVMIPLQYIADNPDNLLTQQLHKAAKLQAEHRIKMSSLRNQYRYQFELATQWGIGILFAVCVISMIAYFWKH